jgi:hypothetical protein
LRHHWLTLPLGSAEYRVYLADADDHLLKPIDACDAANEGATCHETSTIVLRRDLPRKRLPEVLIHEALHAVAHISGIALTLRWKLTREEQVVHSIAPMLAHALVGGGLWKLPKVPR